MSRPHKQRRDPLNCIGRHFDLKDARQSFRFFGWIAHLLSQLHTSLYTLLTERSIIDPFEYEFSYSLEPGGSRSQQRGVVSLGDLADSMVLNTDAERLESAIDNGFNKLAKEISRPLNAIQNSIEKMCDPTGIALSASTFARAAKAFGTHSDIESKWRGEWLAPNGFVELFGLNLDQAIELYHLFDPCRNPEVQEQPLVSVGFMSDELERRIRALVVLPSWM